MLTEKQKKEIAKAAEDGFRSYNFPYSTVVAAIDAYDKIKDEKEVKAANSKTEEMLLDEAIKQYIDKALDNDCTCKRDHLQLASWLAELRVRRLRSVDGND